MPASPVAVATPTAASLRARAETLLPQFRAELAELVAIDSGSTSPDGVDRMGDWCARRLAELGFDVARLPTPVVDGQRFGDVVVARLRGTGARRILLFGHMDTVFADGTAALRPYREEAGRAYGPGVSDDKGGFLAGVHAAQLIVESGFTGFRELVIALTPDEEVGSPASGRILAGLAAGADAALCLECARENGDLVHARKGVADVRIHVRGRAAHAGVEPDRGRSAAVEAAHLVLFAHSLTGARPGLTVNVGTVRAGERANVVPAFAELFGEVRAATPADLDWALSAIEARAAAPAVDDVTSTVERLAVCPPLEPASSTALLSTAVAVGAELGLAVSAAATGGVSDANFVAAAAGSPSSTAWGRSGATTTPRASGSTSARCPSASLCWRASSSASPRGEDGTVDSGGGRDVRGSDGGVDPPRDGRLLARRAQGRPCAAGGLPFRGLRDGGEARRTSGRERAHRAPVRPAPRLSRIPGLPGGPAARSR